MHIADAEITNEWVKFSTLTAVGTSDIFTLVNGSSDILYMVEANDAPVSNVQGNPVHPGCFATYKKGTQDLYIRNGYNPSTNGEVKKSRLIINKKG